ncbi:hypothetical protein [Mucilaginibacter xinganensis]|uniref:Uncharacterized protein n=1 Tax=Mucilaginibacter xinganensis TaxID=1234841 RepID=A0A223NTL2_9SPHI|nr:hypothetical protein [Mucilaginibacter xinganensis]ASU32988.1 hypothetical protein MuYL_1088 [Mucilaginibacter xinganensis]
MKSFFYKGRFIFIPLAGAAFLSLISFVVMSLWNCLLPDILHVAAITFWQAMGIFVLCKILFGFGKGGGPGKWGGGAPWMRRRMEEKFKAMTPEEREKFKEKWQNCGHGRWGRHAGNPYDKYWDEPKSAEKEL